MRKALLIIGIVCVVLGVLAFILAAFFLWMHGSVVDGSNTLYQRLMTQRNISLIAGFILAIIGAVCFVARGFLK